MTAIKDRVMPTGPKFIEFVANQEPWTQYTLENGAIMRIRPVLVKVIDEGVYGPDSPTPGMPKYNIQINQMMDVTWPPEIQAQIDAAQKTKG